MGDGQQAQRLNNHPRVVIIAKAKIAVFLNGAGSSLPSRRLIDVG